MMEITDFCCVCVKNNSFLINIENFDQNNITYRKKLSICVADQNWKTEFNICKDCIVNLDFAYNFVLICSKSEAFRNEQIKILEENEHLTQKLCKEQLSHIRLRSYFQEPKRKKMVTQITPKDIEEKADTVKENIEQSNSFESLNDHCSSDEGIKPQLRKNYSKRKVPLTCEYCGKTFNRKQHYSAHIRAKHTFEKPYNCDLCDAKYTNSHSLLVHKRKHNNEKPFVCFYCGKSFVCSGDLYHHSKIHLNKREYKCNLCVKSFNTASILRTHKICMHLESKDWKYECKFCQKRFPINSSLVSHMKRHIGIREFTCHICQKEFYDKSELSKHLKSHSDERLFKCNICENKEYKNNYGLKKHLKIIHNIGTIKIVKPEKKFACSVCSKTFAFNNKLQKHLCTHTGEKPFKCQYCDKKFIENYYRKLHLKKKHNIDEVVDQIN